MPQLKITDLLCRRDLCYLSQPLFHDVTSVPTPESAATSKQQQQALFPGFPLEVKESLLQLYILVNT